MSKPGRITLFVDDNGELIETVGESLRSELNYSDFEIACSPQEARRILSERDVGQVISDWRMPPDDGIDFLCEVRREYPSVDCTLLTGHASDLTPEDRSRLGSAGVPLIEKRNLGLHRLAGLVGAPPPPATVAESAVEPQTQDMNDEERLLRRNLRIEQLAGTVQRQREALRMFADDLLEDLRQMRVQKGGCVIGPGEPQTLDDVIREIEELTPEGVRLIKLDREARRRVEQLTNRRRSGK
jgi:CheY-like chemotaxis protein